MKMDEEYINYEWETCPDCDGRGFTVTCWDDLCHGQEECIHGDGYTDCNTCDGTGQVKVPPVTH